MKNKKNVVWWPAVKNSDHIEKFGGYEYFQYSRNTWEYWCKKNNVLFVPFEIPVEKDLFRYRVNWQKAIFLFDELERMNINYDQIALVDSSFMIKWNAPNFFDMTDRRFTAWRDTDNMRWIYDSIQGYKEIFQPRMQELSEACGVHKFDITKYVNSGFMVFNKDHKDIFTSFKNFYIDNIDEFIFLQDKKVKKGTEQTPMNYWLQLNQVDINLNLPMAFKLTHLPRKDLLRHNWQLDEGQTPFFIKYGYNFSFNGIPKDQRNTAMEQTWNIMKENYK